MFGVLWWIYGGYAWLTNTRAPTRRSQRLLLPVGMAGFMIVALATPRAFEGDGVAWGLGYLVVVLVHAGLYVQSKPWSAGATPTRRLAPGSSAPTVSLPAARPGRLCDRRSSRRQRRLRE
jgi:low temperature requirement protein LtrA